MIQRPTLTTTAGALGFGVKRLFDLPMGWSDQWSALGLKASAQTYILVATTSIADFGAATDKQHRETEVLHPWRLSGTIVLDPRASRNQGRQPTR